MMRVFILLLAIVNMLASIAISFGFVDVPDSRIVASAAFLGAGFGIRSMARGD
jgi:hypothetical protein